MTDRHRQKRTGTVEETVSRGTDRQMRAGTVEETVSRGTYQGTRITVGDEVVQQNRHVGRFLLQKTDIGEGAGVTCLKPQTLLMYSCSSNKP